MSGSFHWPSFLPAFQKAAQKQNFHATTLAETSAGPIVTWERPGPGPCIYLSSGIHGDEPAGPMALLRLMESEKNGFFSPAAHWLLCPALNPTGLSAGTREAENGMDLNRDYLLRKTPEIQSHAAWLEKLEIVPQLFLSLHEDWEASGFYFYEINLGPDDPLHAHTILDAVRPWIPPDPRDSLDGHTPREAGWIYHEARPDVPHGWPEAIFLAKQNCPISFTFETPSHAPLETRVQAQCAAVKAAVASCFPLRSPLF